MVFIIFLTVLLAGVSAVPEPAPAPCYQHHHCVGCPSVQVCPGHSLTVPRACSRDGILPDGADCQTYHVCSNGVSHTFKCDNGRYFNGTVCKSLGYCRTFSCAYKLSGQKVIHPIDNTVFAYCIDGAAKFVDRCPPRYRMYPESNKCLPECQRNGQYIADPDSKTTYYKCSQTYYSGRPYSGRRYSGRPYSGRPFKVTQRSCSPGTQFCPSCSICSPTCHASKCNV